MAEAVTTIDKAGRVVIPKEIREKMSLNENSILLVVETDGDALILKKLDIHQVAERLRGELKGKDLDGMARKVEAQSNERVRKERRGTLRR
jgi:AbrB family looped-hinge helix DNA binding protein